jgi:propanol-preferring alcohol dehydrogenase
MVLERIGAPLALRDVADPQPAAGQVLLRVRACGVCRTDLHIVDGELEAPSLPLVIGHQIVGTVVARGPGASRFPVGARVGVPWVGWTCGRCGYCLGRRENLCDNARFTGLHIDGGYAELTVADERYCFEIPAGLNDAAAAPLLCGGAIGYRALVLAGPLGEARRLGFYGFGSAAHLVAQVALFQGREVYAFTRPADRAGQDFARGLGARWAGGSDDPPPEPLDAALIFAPVGALVPAALRAVRKGGTVVCAGIHMSDIPSFPYRDLWNERAIRSVANLTRRDCEELLALAPRVPIRASVRTFALEQANEALAALRAGEIEGSAVVAVAG